ncbi:unnamed protein product [Prunus armeniaca]
MSSSERSQSPNSQVPLYLWGDSKVYKKWFVANLHYVVIGAKFQKWRDTFASAIHNNVHVRLVEPSTNNVPYTDLNNPCARIITFHPLYFSLGFMFPCSSFSGGVFCAMECALSQCIPNVYRAIIYIDNLNRFFKLGLTVGEFFYFFEVRRCEKYAQLCMSNAKLFDSFSQGDHVWNADVLEINSKWEGEVDNGPPILTTYCNVKDITQKLDLGPDMAKLRQALNIHARFRELRWLLSEH